MCVGKEFQPRSVRQASLSMAKLMQTVRLTQIDPKGHYLIIVYTQSLDAAALRIADTQGSRALFTYRSIQQPG